jgi:hypothetical protein
VSTITIGLSDEDVARIATEVAARLEPRGGGAGWLDVKGASTYSSLSEEAIRTAAKRGKLRSHRGDSGRVMFRVEDIDAFLGEAL